ncbi:proprotein convertase subtilisin/kexin type 1 inhibitor, like [Polypterus senegalus]|uniref:proprotein convertase subtilisin/kexin type 1 inhibitor, like n=1 Tax=Polypterus senegalus TaxID=55291 RepID=UPI00196545AF|nr:proprotein convertase subtilisin/kexin type 1 inhibitor, like [Polypterus senegalus]
MTGPLGFTALVLTAALCLSWVPATPGKPVNSVGQQGVWSHDEVGTARRFRRDLRDSLPYEAEMMAYPAAEMQPRLRNDIYQQGDNWDQRLGLALQQMVEDGRRRNQEAAYLANMLRLLSEVGQEGYVSPIKSSKEPSLAMGDFQGQYPSDYDETGVPNNMVKPQGGWQNLLDPQLAQALLNHYRQQRLYETSLGPASRLSLQDAEGEAPEENEDETLRYLLGRILAGMTEGGQQLSRLSKQDLASITGGSKLDHQPGLKRSRRSLDDGSDISDKTNLLRVKRLDDTDEETEITSEDPRNLQDGAYHAVQAGLQRMKRIDTEQNGKPIRRRRYVGYDPDELAERILKYLPD